VNKNLGCANPTEYFYDLLVHNHLHHRIEQ
jgi:hypothetical protein